MTVTWLHRTRQEEGAPHWPFSLSRPKFILEKEQRAFSFHTSNPSDTVDIPISIASMSSLV